MPDTSSTKRSTAFNIHEYVATFFLPAAGSRDGSSVKVGGGFWSSTARDEEDAYLLVFYDRKSPFVSYDGRYLCYSVRLVKEVK